MMSVNKCGDDCQNEQCIFMKAIGLKFDDVRDWLPPPHAAYHQIYCVQNDVDYNKSKYGMCESKPRISSEADVGNRKDKGYLISLNDELIALFKVRGEMFAIMDSCPHSDDIPKICQVGKVHSLRFNVDDKNSCSIIGDYKVGLFILTLNNLDMEVEKGGPLSMGDIEELPGSGICVRCPWHHWKVQLKSGQVAERHDISKCAITYPVKVTDDGDIYIGFHHISPSFFNIDRGNCLSFS